MCAVTVQEVVEALRAYDKAMCECGYELAVDKTVADRIEAQGINMTNPVAYITKAAIEALKSGKVSSVRVWRNPDEPNGDVPLCLAECKHQYWYAGEPDCPAELLADNGELVTVKCKLCGEKP